MYKSYRTLVKFPVVIRAIKSSLAVVPSSLLPLFVWRRRLLLNRQVVSTTGGTVKYGFFAGQKLSGSVFWGDTDVASQALGFYELEVLNELEASEEKILLINLGAADGYYSVGWARSSSKNGVSRQAIAFEIQERGRKVIFENSTQNNVSDKVKIYGAADKASLMSLSVDVPMNQVVILSDLEGFEYQIVDEETLRQFAGAKWIIEAHEFDAAMEESLANLIEIAVKGGYSVRTLKSGPRNPHEIQELLAFSDVDRWLLCAEGRDGLPGKWLVIE